MSGPQEEALERAAAPAPRGAPLVASWARWALSAGALAAAFVLAIQGYVVFTHSDRTLASFAWPVALAVVTESLLLLAILRAEESRLARELRTARTGTAVLRGMVARRRQQTPFLARLFATQLGTAAVLLADGERSAALDALAASSPLMQWGRLEKLRAVVEADVERSAGNSVGLERCVQRLRATAPVGNREADLYRTHVLVKALLEQGDADTALEVARELATSRDEEELLYVTWLRVWFELDGDAGREREREDGADPEPWRPLGEGELRLAMLQARSHGAEKLVEMLEARVSSIARPGDRG